MDWCSSSHAATAHCTPATFAFYTQSHTIQARSMASCGSRSSRMTKTVDQLSLALCLSVLQGGGRTGFNVCEVFKFISVSTVTNFLAPAKLHTQMHTVLLICRVIVFDFE